jgi:hypothetical protein
VTPTGLPVVAVTRYVTPLREGGSLPGIVEADDLGIYVCKFRGAGQGVRVLVAEVIVAGLAERLGLRTPRLVALDLDPQIARYEADEEVQDLLNASPGLNLGADFLPGSFGFDGHVPADSADAVRVLWLDAFVANVDRSWRNPNLLVWHGGLYLIDHGAALTFHHQWSGAAASTSRPFAAGDHVLIGAQPDVDAADEALAAQVTDDLLWAAVNDVPDEWLTDEPGFESPKAVRTGYLDWLVARLAAREQWLPGLRAAATGDTSRHAPSPRRRTGRPAWLTSGAREGGR